MNRLLPALGFALLTAGLAGPAAAQGGAGTGVVQPGRPPVPDSVSAAHYPEDAPNWLPMEEAVAAAQAEGDFLLIHAYAVWCGWCRRLDNDTYTDDAVQAYLTDNFEVTRLDIESTETVNFFGGATTMRALAEGFEVSGTPSTIFFDADGNFVTMAPSYWPPERFLLVLRYVREGFHQMMPFTDYVEMIEAEQGG
jgi:thioredoxin-related protein